MSTTTLRYNVVSREGDDESVTVFIGGEPLVATKDHPAFIKIVKYLKDAGPEANADEVRALFDLNKALPQVVASGKFMHLSERVTYQNNGVYFDGDPMATALTDTIMKFMAHETDFMPLVNFFEKIQQNPNEHSREHLYRWLEIGDFAIAPDGDFIAYKGVDSQQKSITSGEAMVNGMVVKGKIPNAIGTVIEMPRSKVRFDPHTACSTGLHAGNWRYAQSFARGKVLQVKINPRDVVSVPVDSSNEKLRVCRYKVVGVVTAQDPTLLYLKETIKTFALHDEQAAKERQAALIKEQALEQAKADKPERSQRAARKAAAKIVKAKKAEPPVPVDDLPSHYEKFTAKHFNTCPMTELRWLAKEWEIKPQPKTKPDMIKALVKEAKERLKTW
jgi:hypothetical protein